MWLLIKSVGSLSQGAEGDTETETNLIRVIFVLISFLIKIMI